MISPNAADLMLERVAPSLTEHVYFAWQSTSRHHQETLHYKNAYMTPGLKIVKMAAARQEISFAACKNGVK